MKYAIKLTRNTRSGEVTVHPVIPVQNSTQPFRLRYPECGFAESLQIYDTEAEARRMAEQERYAAELTRISQEELHRLFSDSLKTLKNLGFPVRAVCKLTGLPMCSIHAYRHREIPQNPRVVARLRLLLPLLTDLHRAAHEILPGPGCGRPKRFAVSQKDPE